MSIKMLCCEKCHLFWTCETKWFRGERSEKNTCCPTCNFFEECLKLSKKTSRPSAKKSASKR